MNCKTAQTKIALWVGQDLDDTEFRDLRKHVSECQVCAKHLARMKTSMKLLHCLKSEPEKSPQKSLWPKVAVGVAKTDVSSRATRFNGWVPAAAVVAACLVLVIFSRNTTMQSNRNGDNPSVISGGSVGFDINSDQFTKRYKEMFGSELEEFYPDESWKNNKDSLKNNLRRPGNSALRSVTDQGF